MVFYRWGGVVWYQDGKGDRKRKSFSGTTKQEVNQKITDYIAALTQETLDSDESKKTLQVSMQKWLEVFKFPSVERTTYDRCEYTAKHQVYPALGDKIISDITAVDIKALLNQKMNEGYAYTTVKKMYVLLGEYFRYLPQQKIIVKNSLRRKYTPRVRPQRRLYTPGELPKMILQNLKSRRDRTHRNSQTAASAL